MFRFLVPDRPPDRVQAHRQNEGEIKVTWEKVPPVYENGLIKGYKVVVREVGAETDELFTADGVDEREMAIGGLGPNGYGVRVLAYTAVGDGPASEELLVKTGEARSSTSYS